MSVENQYDRIGAIPVIGKLVRGYIERKRCGASGNAIAEGVGGAMDDALGSVRGAIYTQRWRRRRHD